MIMSPDDYLMRRNAYPYPAMGLSGHLDGLLPEKYPSLTAMEAYHLQALSSSDDSNAVVGYLSVIYWGHYSGQDEVLRPGWALSKVKRARARVLTMGVVAVAQRLRLARQLLEQARFGEAARLLTKLPELGFAFASKVCAFMKPTQCGVIDSVIAANRPEFGFAVNHGGFVKPTLANKDRYQAYCERLVTEARELNTMGPAYKWQDRDRTQHEWRAVDVERALY